LTAGLAAAGVALILSAAIGLARGQCKDEVTRLLCLMSATVAFYYTSNFIFPLLIVVGGLTTLYTKRNDDVALKDTTEKIHKLGVPKLFGAILILTWITIWVVVASIKNTTEYSDGRSTKVLHWCVLLKLVPIRPRWRGERRSLRTLPGASLRPPLAFNPRPRRLSTSTDAFELHPDLRFEAFYRTGSIIFGGGQVVLPLLLDDVVQYDRVCTTSGGTLVYDVTDASVCDSYTSVESEDSWITADQFFAGLGVVQVRRGLFFSASLSLSLDHTICHVIVSGT
jgi:chromate transporter